MTQAWHKIKRCLKKIRYGINPKYRPFRQVRDRYRAGLKQVEEDVRRGNSTDGHTRAE